MKLILRSLAVTVALASASCNLFEPKPPMKITDAAAVVPPDFLFSRYAPLNAWLDTSVRVQIFDVPLMDTFQTPALRGLNYRIISRPEHNPLITIDKPGLTRRQLLWALSQDHALHLSAIFTPDGGPAWIEIRSRQATGESTSSSSHEERAKH